MEKICELRKYVKELHRKHKHHHIVATKIKVEIDNYPSCPNPWGCDFSQCSQVSTSFVSNFINDSNDS